MSACFNERKVSPIVSRDSPVPVLRSAVVQCPPPSTPIPCSPAFSPKHRRNNTLFTPPVPIRVPPKDRTPPVVRYRLLSASSPFENLTETYPSSRHWVRFSKHTRSDTIFSTTSYVQINHDDAEIQGDQYEMHRGSFQQALLRIGRNIMTSREKVAKEVTQGSVNIEDGDTEQCSDDVVSDMLHLAGSA